jgi:hypothetical protein
MACSSVWAGRPADYMAWRLMEPAAYVALVVCLLALIAAGAFFGN